ncbi:uncharacterized protein JCM15063_001533 [Sporobolomyces koalae]|uniref:uncharacterized protein n=1 Tax=Sporobolomyces koalae TaxID=500713 RepID=UPI00316CA3C3
MSQVRPTPEVLSLVAPASFTWMRVFLSLVVLLVFLLIALFSPKSAKPISVKKARNAVRTVLLVGPLASGKTGLFSRLVYGQRTQSFTSMKENEGVVSVKRVTAVANGEKADEKDVVTAELARPLHLVDLPGHPRLRTRSLAQFLPAADGIVFTIDALTGLAGKNVRDAGEHLHVLLSLLSLLSNRRPSTAMPPLLILLTKSDLLNSGSSSSSTPTKTKSPTLTLDRAKQSLARELERRRAVSTVGNSTAGAKLEGLEAIPTGASNSSVLSSILAAFGFGASTVTTGTNENVEGLPSDEAELLSNEHAFLFEGAFEWDKVERALGIEIKWALASSFDETSEGLVKLWDWVEQDL